MATTYPPETNDGVVTSWVPLTTTFTPSIGCESKFRLNGPSLVAYDPGYGLDIDSRVKCAPPAVTTWWEQGRLGGGNDAGHTAASIGPLTCPNAWSTVVTSVRGSSTLAMCCPPDYYLAHGVPGSVAGDCLSDVTPGAVLTFASTPFGSPDWWSIATTNVTRRSAVGAIAVVGWVIAMETPTTLFATSLTSSSTTSAPPSAAAGTTTSTNPIAGLVTGGSEGGSSTGAVSSGLPTGAVVGLGLGVGLGVVGIAALIAAICLIRARKRKSDAIAAVATQFIDGDYLPPPPPKLAETLGDGPHELVSEGVLLELPVSQHRGHHRPYELP